jgi:hypothetical protein
MMGQLRRFVNDMELKEIPLLALQERYDKYIRVDINVRNHDSTNTRFAH